METRQKPPDAGGFVGNVDGENDQSESLLSTFHVEKTGHYKARRPSSDQREEDQMELSSTNSIGKLANTSVRHNELDSNPVTPLLNEVERDMQNGRESNSTNKKGDIDAAIKASLLSVNNRHDKDDSTTEHPALLYAVLKTAALVIAWICLGAFVMIIGVTLIDFKVQLRVTYEEIARAIAAKDIGHIVGAIVGGFLRDRVPGKADLIIAISMTTAAITLSVKPWLTSLTAFGAAFVFIGLSHGATNAVGNTMCLKLWGKNAAGPLQAMHLGFGIGALLIPLLSMSFISGESNILTNSAFTTNGSSNNGSLYAIPWADNSSHHVNYSYIPSYEAVEIYLEDSYMNESRLYIPYSIISGFTFLTALFFYSFFIHSFILERKLKKSNCQKNKSFQNPLAQFDKKSLPIILLVLLFLFYFNVEGLENTMGTYLFAYTIETGVFRKNEAIIVLISYRSCYTFGRAIAALLPFCVSVNLMLPIEIILTCATTAALTFVTTNRRVVIWVFSCLLAAVFSPIYPHGVAWTDKYITVTGLIIAIFDIGAGTGNFIIKWLVGHLIERFDENFVLYLSFSCSVVLLCLIIIMQFVANKLNRIKVDR